MDLGIPLISTIIFLTFGTFGLISLLERERRAARVSFIMAFLCSSPIFLLTALPQPTILAVLIGLAVLITGFVLLALLPIGQIEVGNDIPQTRYDERMRNRPGLYSPKARIVNPTLLASPKASFYLADSLYPAVDGPVSGEKSKLPPEEMTAYIKNLAKYYGA